MDERTPGKDMRRDLASLPTEIQSSILSRLNRNDLFFLSLTCRRLSKVAGDRLWQSVHIVDEAACKTVRDTLRSRPALAQTITKLELHTLPDEPENRQDDGIYSDLALAASLPNLKHLDIYSACREFDQSRSLKASQELLKLSRLESCCIQVYDEEARCWNIEDALASFSLISIPSLREFRVNRFDSAEGLCPRSEFAKQILGQGRATPLRKLSLFTCDIDPKGLAGLMRITQPLELELVHAPEYPIFQMRTSLYHGIQEYIDAVQSVGQASLETFTYYSDYDDVNKRPGSFCGFERLKHLRADMSTLCGTAPDFRGHDSDDKIQSQVMLARNFLLPAQLEVLEILFCFGVGISTQKALGFVEQQIIAHQQQRKQKIKEVRFVPGTQKTFSGSELDDVRDFGLRCGLAATISDLPEKWGA